jgi:hypothetical protein
MIAHPAARLQMLELTDVARPYWRGTCLACGRAEALEMHHDTSEKNKNRPNPASEKEPAEGSRENTNAPRGGELPPESFGEGDHEGGGISNRPIGEEQGRQEQVPPSGERKEDSR